MRAASGGATGRSHRGGNESTKRREAGGKQTGEAGWMEMAGSDIDADRGICLCRIRARHALEKRVESSGGVRPKPEMWDCSSALEDGESGER